MVERSLSMREALGSMPRFSSFVFVRVFLGISASPEITFTAVCSYSSVGQSVRLITVRSAVQARVGAPITDISSQALPQSNKPPLGIEPRTFSLQG
jgi:hypothetical protein